MLALVAVGTTRVIVSPARASNDSNSPGVRSAPPVNVIIIMSALPKPGALPSRSTSSMMSNRLIGVIAARQFAQDSKATLFVPVVDDVREDIGVRPWRHGLERAARLNRHPVLDTQGP